jgi:hypothetical protein
MSPRQFREVIERATEAVLASLMARAHAIRGREGWRIWRAHWAELEKQPPAERLLAVCMYCERFRVTTGEWVATPPGFSEMLRHPELFQITHGVCPICLAEHLERLGEDAGGV